MRAKLLHATLLGLIGAGIVHIVILFLLPDMSPRDAWSRLARQAETYQISTYAADSVISGPAGVADPFFQAVACRFDLTDGVTHVHREGRVPYWSASVYDRGGRNLYSLNDRSATDGQLDLVVLTPDQMVDMRKSPVEELQNAIFVEAPISEGIVVIRGFAPDGSWARTVSEYLNAIECVAQTS